MKKKEEKRIPDRERLRNEEKQRNEKNQRNEEKAQAGQKGGKDEKTPDKELIEAQMKREAGDENRTQTTYQGNIEVTALNDPPVHRETRSMPRTSKAVTDALIKKRSKGKRQKAGSKGK